MLHTHDSVHSWYDDPSRRVALHEIQYRIKATKCISFWEKTQTNTIMYMGSQVSSYNHYHLPIRFIGLHDPMSFAYILELEHSRGFGFEFPRGDVCSYRL